jgi:HEAT repeat protein
MKKRKTVVLAVLASLFLCMVCFGGDLEKGFKKNLKELDSKDVSRAAMAAEGIGREAGNVSPKLKEQAISKLLKLLKKSRNISLRQSVLKALEFIGDDKTVPELAVFLNDPDAGVQMGAVNALGKIKNETTLSILKDTIKDRGRPQGTRIEAAKVLGLFLEPGLK